MYSLKCANCRLFVLTESCEGKYTLFVTMAIFEWLYVTAEAVVPYMYISSCVEANISELQN